MGMNSLILGILRRDPYKEVLYFPTFSSGKRAQMICYETLFYFLYNYNISKIMFFLCEDFNLEKKHSAKASFDCFSQGSRLGKSF